MLHVILIEFWRWRSRRRFLLLYGLRHQGTFKYVVAKSTQGHRVDIISRKESLGDSGPVVVAAKSKRKTTDLLLQIGSLRVVFWPGGRGAARVGIRISAKQ